MAAPTSETITTGATALHHYRGLNYVDSNRVARTVLGKPVELSPGTPFELLVLHGGTGVQLLFPYGRHELAWFGRTRTNATTDPARAEWSPWRQWGNAASPAAPPRAEHSNYWAAHSALETRFVASFGGPIDTRGRAAVAFRFDHGLRAFRDKVLPLMSDLGVTVAQAYNPRNWHYPENEGVTPAELNSWIEAGLVEIWNHSASHAGPDTMETLKDQVIGGLEEIEAQLPAARGKVWGWNPPGVTNGDYCGFHGGKTSAGWASPAGQLILKHHAVATGSLPGTQFWPLDGRLRIGKARYQIDAVSPAEVKGKIDTAIDRRCGLLIMLHPSVLDRPGKLSTSDLQEIVGHIAERRDTGLLVTLSPYELMLADATRPPVPSLGIHDTGWSELSCASTGLADGSLKIRRLGDEVHFRMDSIRLPDHAHGSLLIPARIPEGYRSDLPGEIAFAMTTAASPGIGGTLRIHHSGDARLHELGSRECLSIYARWTTADTRPQRPTPESEGLDNEGTPRPE